MYKLLKTLFIPLALMASCAAHAGLAPDALARNTTNEVIQIVKKDEDIRNGRSSKIYSLVETKILPHFDFEHMTKLAMGRNWSLATPEQQARLVEEFRSRLVITYSAAISNIADYQVDFKPVRMSPSDTDVTVSSEVVKPGAPAITIDYRMEKTGDAWKVYDVMVDQVSLITTFRSNFNSEIRKGGVDGLIQALSRRNQHK